MRVMFTSKELIEDAEAKHSMQTDPLQSLSVSYYRVMMSEKPSTH